MSESGKFHDKILICIDCHEEFAFTIGAQEYFAERGFVDDPKRCRQCYSRDPELQLLNKRRGKPDDDDDGGMAVWQPKIPPGFVPPQSGVNWNLPDGNRDQQH